MVQKIIEKLRESDKIALFHHINPDGDTLTSSYGLALALRSVFPKKEIKVVANQEELFSRFNFINFDESIFINEIDSSWTTIVGDTSEPSRIDRFEEFEKGKVQLCFDHHQNVSEYDFDVYWREPDWIASSLQAVEIAKELNVAFDENIAFHLMIGILTDSGNFAFSLADPMPVNTYGFLLSFIGNQKMDSFFKSMKKRTSQDIEIEKFMLNNLAYDSKVATLKVTQNDLNKLGVQEKDIKIKVNKLGNIEGYNIWALFTEVEQDGKIYIKGSIRSNGPNVSSVAANHKGGGHKRASGIKAVDWKEVEQIIKELNTL